MYDSGAFIYPEVTYSGSLTIWYWDSFYGGAYTSTGYFSPTTAQANTNQSNWPIPDWEGTSHIANPSQHSIFLARLFKNPPVIFNGRIVMETTGVGSSDFCWHPGSAVQPYVAVTGGQWNIITLTGNPNYWDGPDEIGWDIDEITYYRAGAFVPCATIVVQDMWINVPNGWTKYYTGDLMMMIAPFDLKNDRHGVSSGFFPW
jgi:hypothetical protein